MPDAALVPVAAHALRRDGHRLARRRRGRRDARAARPSSSVTARSACAACWRPRRWAPSASSRMSRHEPRQEIARAFGATDVVAGARRGGRGARSASSPTASAPTRCSSASAPTQSMETAFAVARPGVDGRLRRRAARRGAARAPDVPAATSAWPAAWRPVRRYLPELLDLVLSGRDRPRAGLRPDPAAGRGGRGLPGDGRASRHQGPAPTLTGPRPAPRAGAENPPTAASGGPRLVGGRSRPPTAASADARCAAPHDSGPGV